ncbi:MAG: hypothetical protein KIS66_17235 [Fimbriimonadaceae bacterium]|nr:hypothetical protein [Fimbriimonadaceae bacterium]
MYASYFGGSSSDTVQKVIPTADGYFLGGDTTSSNIPSLTDYQAGWDVYVARFARDHRFLRAMYIGSTATDSFGGLAMRSNGSLVLGITTGGNVGTVGGVFDTTRVGTEGHLSILDPSLGAYLVAGTYIGGSGSDSIEGVATLGDRIVVLGTTGTTADWPAWTLGSTRGSLGGTDIFVAFLTAGFGTLDFVYFIGGSDSDLPRDVDASEVSNLVVVGGRTYSSPSEGLDLAGPSDGTFGGDSEGFFLRFQMQLYFALKGWNYVGGDGEEDVTGVAIGPGDQIHVTGYGTSAANIVFRNAFQSTASSGAQTPFWGRYSGSVVNVLSFFGGTTGTSHPKAIDVDSFGQAHIVGSASGGVATTPDAYQPTNGGGLDGFYARIATMPVYDNPITTSAVRYLTFYGRSGDQDFSAVSCYEDEGFAVGHTAAAGLPITSDASDRDVVGSGTWAEGLVTKFMPTTLQAPFTDPAALSPGASALGVVPISGPLATDITVQLGSSSSRFIVPPSVVVPSGQTWATFLAYPQDVLSSMDVTLSAYWNGRVQSSVVHIHAPSFGGLFDFDGGNGAGRPSTVDLEFREKSRPDVLITKRVAVDAQGRYQTDAPSNREFDVSVKELVWLRKTQTFDTRTGEIANADFHLFNGDCNGDNRVNIADFLVLRSAFGTSSGSPNFREGADLTRDGSVNIADFLILRRNFGRTGDA